MTTPRAMPINGCAAFALLYVSLYEVSGWISGNQAVAGIASIFFLPAFVRLLGFLIIGYWIVPTLFVAGLCLTAAGAYNLAPGHSAELIVTAFTAAGGPLGVAVAASLGKLEVNLSNLTPLRLLALSAACAAGNAIAYQIALQLAGLQYPTFADIIAVFLGDFVGSWAIIYLIKGLLTAYGWSLGR